MTIKKFLSTSLASLFILTTSQVYADAVASTWTLSNAPEGETSGTMLAAPTQNPTAIFLSSFLSNGPIFYRSIDGCKTWKPGPTLGLPVDTAVSLTNAVSDNQGNVYNVFADANPMNNAQDKIYELPAGQNHWLQKPTTGLPAGWQISSLVVDKAGNIYAGLVSSELKYRGIFELPYKGSAWTKLAMTGVASAGGGAALIITALSIDNAGNLYAAISNAGVFEWAVGSHAWVGINDGLPQSTTTSTFLITELVSDKSNNMYMATDLGIFKLPEGSTTWVAQNQGLDSALAAEQQSINIGMPVPFTLQIDINGLLYAKTPDGIFSLQNDTWLPITVDGVINPDVYDFAINANNKLCVITAKGIFLQN